MTDIPFGVDSEGREIPTPPPLTEAEKRALNKKGGTPTRQAVARPFSEVERERIEWVWRDRVARGATTMLVGDPGLGKSLLTCRLAAELTRGELTGTPGTALMASAEDHHAAVVRPRLEAAGADLERVFSLRINVGDFEDGLWLPDDLGLVEGLVSEHAIGLLVIDPLMAHLPANVDSHRDQDVRLALAPLQRIAEKHACAVLVVAHLNKQRSSDPLTRTGGSIGLTAAARSVLLLARDPDDPLGKRGGQRVLAQTKSNYGEIALSLGYVIESVPVTDDPADRTARILEVGQSVLSGEELLTPSKRHAPKVEEAETFLYDELQGGEQPSAWMKKAATSAGISEKTLRDARERLDVQARREGSGRTWWSLPEPRAHERRRHEDGAPSSPPLPSDGQEGHEDLPWGRDPASETAPDELPFVPPAGGTERGHEDPRRVARHPRAPRDRVGTKKGTRLPRASLNRLRDRLPAAHLTENERDSRASVLLACHTTARERSLLSDLDARCPPADVGAPTKEDA